MAEPALALSYSPFSFYPGEIDILQPRPRGSSFDWCASNLRMVSGPYKGRPWRSDLLPYVQGMMNILDLPYVREGLIIAPSQSAKTTLCLGWLFSRQCKRPGPAGILYPDQEAAERAFEQKVQPYILRSPALRMRLSPDRYAMSKTEIRWRDGSSWFALWAGSESRMSSESMEYLLVDEEDANQDKSAVGTVRERPKAYPHTYKILRFCKVRGAEGEGTIWADMHSEAHVIFRYLAKCPLEACAHEQHMRFEQIRVPEGMRDPRDILHEKSALYECEACGFQWNDRLRDKALDLGRWEGDRQVDRPTVVGFHLRSWELPFVSLSKVMADWFAAQGNPRKLQIWDNDNPCKPFQTIVLQSSEDELLRLRDPELQPGVVPARAVALTMAVDMQKRDFWYSVWAHALDPREDWMIEYGKIPDWDALDLMLDVAWPVEGSDRTMHLWRATLDTGGGAGEGEDASRTQQAIEWLWKQPLGRIWGIKGKSRKTPGEWVGWSDKLKLPNGKKLPYAYRLFMIDTDEFKRLLHSRLQQDAKEAIHFHAETKENYVRQLLAEELRRKKNKEVWVKVRRDNHLLDCAVGHLAMTHMQWTPNLRMVVMAGAAQGEAKPQKPKPKGKVSRW